eukprot:TRINITY_DN192_c0_g2_i1.p1 TRINITY_DN192_c0_g2~~TRINITY_DN192_c0_g2_i1.p1  ORF type:complete len:407 (-),score=35.94 TRINITY_DN192_c0_g2_i1:1497-2717(-)
MQNRFSAPSSSTSFNVSSVNSQSSSPLGHYQLLAGEDNQHMNSSMAGNINTNTASVSEGQLLTDILNLLIQDPTTVLSDEDLQTIIKAVQAQEMQEKLKQQQLPASLPNQFVGPMASGQGIPNLMGRPLQRQLPAHPNMLAHQVGMHPQLNHPYATSALLSRFGQIPSQYAAPYMQREFKPRNTRSGRQQAQYSHLIERTIYVTELVHDITEADIANFFSRCGEVVDCRISGDAHSRMRFAFVEFSQNTYSFAVTEALKLNNTALRGVPIRVQKSKTAIIPISPKFLPQNEEEALRCQRTVCVKNIDKRFTMEHVKAFFENLAVDENIGADGRVERVKLVPDNSGPSATLMAYVEFCQDESVACAMSKCQGALMGCLPLRICASKIPIRTPEEERSLRDNAANGIN